MPSPKRAVVLLSGGLDSSTLLHQLLYEDFEVTALAVRYGQRHSYELTAANHIAELAGVPLVVCAADFGPIFASARSSQVGARVDVPEGHYADEAMKLTIVPNRNMLLLSMAGALAVSVAASVVAYAAHAGDHPIYPDCRPEFVALFDTTLRSATGDAVRLYAPFVGISKTDIVRRGAQLRVPFEHTYSCYAGRAAHCGRCGTCYERREAFRDARVPDPTTYDDSRHQATVA
jgi:7-cyano-7-deazaguanine synthase